MGVLCGAKIFSSNILLFKYGNASVHKERINWKKFVNDRSIYNKYRWTFIESRVFWEIWSHLTEALKFILRPLKELFAFISLAKLLNMCRGQNH